MTSKLPNSESQDPQAEAVAARQAAFNLELQRLLSRLKFAKVSGQPEQALVLLRQWMNENPLSAHPTPWWSILFRPAATIKLRRARALTVATALEQLAAEAHFGVALGPAESRLMRHLIAAGVVTRWRLFCVLTSGACRTGSSGTVEPNEPSALRLRSGAAIMACLGGAMVLLVGMAALDYVSGCFEPCGLLGVGLVAPYLFGFGYMTYDVTFGRRTAAKTLRHLLRHAESPQRGCPQLA